MTWVNAYEVQDLADFFDERQPNLHRAAQVLLALMRWTNSHSDGWHMWPKPSRSASKLVDLLEQKKQDARDHLCVSRPGESGVVMFTDATEAEVTKAMSPVKAFLTRHKDIVTDQERDAILTAGIPKPPTTEEIIYKITHEAGLPMMRGVLEVLVDRDHEDYVRGLDSDDVEFLYVNYVGPAIDKIEDEIGDPA